MKDKWLKTIILSIIINVFYLVLSFILFGFSTTTEIYNDNLYLYVLLYLLSFTQAIVIIDTIEEF